MNPPAMGLPDAACTAVKCETVTLSSGNGTRFTKCLVNVDLRARRVATLVSSHGLDEIEITLAMDQVAEGWSLSTMSTRSLTSGVRRFGSNLLLRICNFRKTFFCHRC